VEKFEACKLGQGPQFAGECSTHGRNSSGGISGMSISACTIMSCV
jgi:hypothetical protein